MVKAYEEVSDKNFIPLNLNIVFRPAGSRQKFIENFEKYVRDSQYFFSHVKGRLKLTFSGVKPNPALPLEEQPPPVKNRYIFTKSFLIQTDIGILSKPGKTTKDAYNEWILYAKEPNERRQNEISLETVYGNLSNEGLNNNYLTVINYTPNFEKIRAN